MNRLRPVALALLLAGLLTGLGTGCSKETGKPINVVIMMIDTLRADRLGVYGHDVKTSRFINQLAKESVLFERAHSPAPWTLPSVVSMMVSAPVCEHSVVVDGQRIDDSFEPLAQRLQGVGYATAAFLRNPYAGEISGLDRGFETSEQIDRSADGKLVDGWLEQKPDRLFFLYLHNTEPHISYMANPKSLQALGFEVSDENRDELRRLLQLRRSLSRFDYGRGNPMGTTDNSRKQGAVLRKLGRLREEFFKLYDAQVRLADRRVGMVVEVLKERQLWDDTLFILVSDHGEEALEHEGWGHDQSVYEELIQVPLLVKLPGGEHAGTRIRTQVDLLDVMPTVLDVLDRRQLAQGSRGKSLLRFLAPGGDRDPGPRVTSMRHNLKKYYRPHHESRGEINLVVMDGAWKGILNVEPDTFELYDLEADPGETNDLAAAEPERVAEMRAAAEKYYRNCLASRREAVASEGTMTDAQEERLRDLGYLQ